MTPRLPHPRQHAPLVHPARPGGGRINLQILTAAYLRAIRRHQWGEKRPAPKPRPQPQQARLEGM